jgi:hypothetical protein
VTRCEPPWGAFQRPATTSFEDLKFLTHEEYKGADVVMHTCNPSTRDLRQVGGL